MNWSIRLKFLIVMSGLLALCLGVYLYMAITVFKSDKTSLVFDLNRSQVSNMTSEVETQFNGVSEQLKLFALLPADLQGKMVDDLFSGGSEIVSIAIFQTQDSKLLRSFNQQKFLQTYGLDKDYFAHLTQETSVPFGNILSQGQDVWNASGAGGPPLIGYGRLVVVQDKNGQPVEQWAVVGFVRLDRFLKSVSVVRLNQVMIVNRRGEVLVQPDAQQLLKHPRLDRDPIFLEALGSKTKLSLVDRTTPEGRTLAAFARGFDDQILVIAKADGGQVFQVVQDFTVRTLLFGTIVLTLVILAAFLLSRSLTENIKLLVERMNLVSTGDLSSTLKLKGRDETITLANSFNQMIHDLKESRDQLEEMNRDLDQKVKDRTAQIEEQNRKIKEVQEALLRTTRLASVGEIAGRTAHEVLNPLTILLTRVGLMQKKVTGQNDNQLSLIDEIRQAWKTDFLQGGFEKLIENFRAPSKVLPDNNLFQEDLVNLEKVAQELRDQSTSFSKDIQFVKHEGERIGKIINGMRRLGHLKSEAKPSSVHEILTDCCHIMNDLFEQRGFTIQKKFTATAFTATVDRDEMVQSVTNLMRNSLQALDDANISGEATHPLVMSLITRTEADSVVIEIEDNGVGVAPEHHKILFDGSFTTKSADQGTGLGLGISRRFVRAYGGEIEFVSSTQMVKTVFRIRLPLSADHLKQGAVA